MGILWTLSDSPWRVSPCEWCRSDVSTFSSEPCGSEKTSGQLCRRELNLRRRHCNKYEMGLSLGVLAAQLIIRSPSMQMELFGFRPVCSAPSARILGCMEQPRVMEVVAWGDEDLLARPCVDCGLITGVFCDFCVAKDRLPGEEWCDNQHTPLCSKCDRKHGRCHYCWGCLWVTPPPHR